MANKTRTRGISVKLPLRYDKEDGPYELIKNLHDTVKQNFKNLVLTMPGERIMNPDFGVGIHGLLFENQSHEVLEEFEERLHDQVNKYLPFVEIRQLKTNFVGNRWNVSIEYFITPLAESDNLLVDLAVDSAT